MESIVVFENNLWLIILYVIIYNIFKLLVNTNI